MNERNITLTGEITISSVEQVWKKLIEFQQIDRDLQQDGCKQFRPITLTIDSYGGHCYAANTLLGVMNESIAPIYTRALGSCMSAAMPIFLMGDYRTATVFTRFMVHDISSMNGGFAQDQKEHIEELASLADIFDTIITKRTKITQARLNRMKKEKRDWFIGAGEAVELKIINSAWF